MRRPEIDPVEIVAAWVPALAQAVVVAFAIGVAMIWIVILKTPVPV